MKERTLEQIEAQMAKLRQKKEAIQEDLRKLAEERRRLTIPEEVTELEDQ